MLSRLSALDIASGVHREGSPTAPVAGSRIFPDSNFPNNATTFVAIKQLQRPGRVISAACFHPYKRAHLAVAALTGMTALCTLQACWAAC